MMDITIPHILKVLILFLLLIGCISDIKYRRVYRFISIPVVLLSIPLLHLSVAAIISIALILVLYKISNGRMGLADLIILIPLLLVVNNVFMFWLIYNIIAIIYLRFTITKDVPAYVPITIAYIFTI
jgi:hypothetical protein